MKKVVLAFSGGLDTSFCVPYLKQEKGLEVHTVMVNTGGFSPEEAGLIGERALELGAECVAHGCTGAGNDQIRFDLVFEVMAPEIEIIAPIRELQLSRQQEIDYLKQAGFGFSWEKSRYSINQGLWGTSIGGVETLSSGGVLPEEAYPSQISETSPLRIKIGFEKGEPVSLDGEKNAPVEIIRCINDIGGRYGAGRDTHVGDTIIGIKGRVGFEAAAPHILIKAHHLLEKHVLTKGQLYWKGTLGEWYGQLMHEAQYLDPVMRDIEAFLDSTQQYVTGEVEVELRPHHFSILGCTTQFDLMNTAFGDYGEANRSLSPQDMAGFTKVLANPLKIYYSVHKKKML